jgi:acetate kinase
MYLDIHLNEEKNNKNDWRISNEKSNVKVFVISTNEELMIAKATGELYEKSIKDKNEK